MGARLQSYKVRLGLLLFGALGLELLLAATTIGSPSDLNAFHAADATFRSSPLHFYEQIGSARFSAWPYPPVYLPVVVFVSKVAHFLDISFDRLIRLPQIGAGLAMAWVVQWHLGWRGVPDRTRLMAAAMVALAPTSIALYSMHGQVDPVQWLPALLAVVAWERLPEDRRAIVAGLLIGLGAGIKIVPGILIFALLPLARTWRERGLLVAASAAIPVVALAPYALVDLAALRDSLDYRGLAGQGGLSMIVQPDLALLRYAAKPVTALSGPEQFVQDVSQFAVILGALAVALRVRVTQPPAAGAVCAVILVVFVAGANFLPPYLSWIVPFAVLAGWWRFFFVTQALALVPVLFRYIPPDWVTSLGLGPKPATYKESLVWALYIPAGVALWCAFAWWLVAWFRRPRPAEAVGEPSTARGAVPAVVAGEPA
jgi:hypothetical protein